MKKLLKWIFIAFVGLVALGMIIEATKSPEQKAAEAAAHDQQITERAEVKKEETVTESLTGPQKNAVRSAKQYLSMAGFSRDGLVQQLSSEAGEGYKVADATFAVDSLNIDWNQEAVKSAKQYLSMQGFSCKGLIQQLSSSAGEKYTVRQATYGAQQAGACN
ncbi:Ltp family lipoprotein [Rhodanobacter soli]|uniref:Putative host cell surface-exposed lipoprotein Ltp-like HTH region domain-containing protein n=1 Tax=Rhodanobacter soli TaxID=590609 RepID=A0ABV2PUR2_9GAMM